MSQAKLSRVRAKLRHRLQLERLLIAEGCAVRHGTHYPEWDGTGPRPDPRAYLETFDVALALDLAHQLISGPACKTCSGAGGSEESGDCDACSGSGRALDPHSVGRRRVGRRLLAALKGQHRECQRCTGRALDTTPPGHRYLRQGAAGLGGVSYVHSLKCPCGESENETVVLREDCPDCQGSGHNLLGVLPPVDWSPAVRRRALEHETHDLHPPRGIESWLRDLAEDARMPPGFCEGIPIGSVFLAKWDDDRGEIFHSCDTRVCPRGEHRDLDDLQIRWEDGANAVDRYAKGWVSVYVLEERPQDLPAWRRGEIKHASQRRAR